MRILDENREPLTNLPKRLTIKSSIFYRVWCDDIEKWRGEGQ